MTIEENSKYHVGLRLGGYPYMIAQTINHFFYLARMNRNRVIVSVTILCNRYPFARCAYLYSIYRRYLKKYFFVFHKFSFQRSVHTILSQHPEITGIYRRIVEIEEAVRQMEAA